MAFYCKLYLKSECDGCGACMGVLEDDDEDEGNPFDIDYNDERI